MKVLSFIEKRKCRVRWRSGGAVRGVCVWWKWSIEREVDAGKIHY